MSIAVRMPGLDLWKAQVRCQAGCPVATDAGRYVQLIAEGRDEEAFLVARAPNPFASVCGRVRTWSYPAADGIFSPCVIGSQGYSVRNAMTVASWLLVVDPEAVDSARRALAAAEGVECRGLAGGRLVVVTESAEGRGLEPVHDALLAVPGVRSAALVAAFEEGEEDRK